MKKIILLSISLFTLSLSALAQDGKKTFTLADIWQKGTFRMKSVPGFNALKDGQRYSQINYLEDGQQNISIYYLENGNLQKTVFDNFKNTFNGDTLSIADYQFNAQENKLLLLCQAQNIYRRSVLYKAYVYDLNTSKIQSVNDQKILHPSFNPQGDKVAFVSNNNLYYKDLNSDATITITQDGKRNEIINGNCDWVYEEEFEFTQAYQWSPNGAYIAYYRFDERNVPVYTMTLYDSLYPTPYQYKYPKAGAPNSIVDIYCYQLAEKKSVAAKIHSENDQYIPRIKWAPNSENLCIYRLNRHQNHLELLWANPKTGMTELCYQESNKYYIEINDNLNFLPDNASFIFSSEQGGYNQLYRYYWKTKKLKLLTKGQYDIESLIGIDEKNQKLYYTAALNKATERKLYVCDWNGKNQNCLSSTEGFHQITPCEGYQYFLDKHSRIDRVPSYSLINAQGKTVRVLEDNAELEKTMNQYQWGKIQLQKIKGKDQLLNAWVIYPPHFDSTKKYPVLMYQYSGPGSQMVADKFPVGDYFWHQYLALKGYLIVCVDGSGTGFRGEAFKKCTYLQLGKKESDDQIAVAQNIAQWPFVEASRIGIWGWSFGGFMSSTCILKGNHVFKTAIAVAPVTNWRYYDNIYTERYMRTPQENKEGYDLNAPENMADSLKGHYLLIHGTADDNVHFQNAVMLSEKLIQKNKRFDNVYYPNKNHGISGGKTRLQLYTKMTDFLLEHL